jgi:uncharacterized protein (DUF1015 family)
LSTIQEEVMANIKPFRGIRYDPARIKDMSTVVSQPYDRVRHGLQDRYYALSDHNVSRIIKGKEFAGDGENNNVYTRAKGYLTKWLQAGILIREEQPAIYVYHQQFTLPNGKQVIRKALVSALELTTFDEGVVLPHERTHSGPKVDRLNLVRATETYFGNILMLYPDPENRIDALLAPAIEREPDVDLYELHEKDVRQMVWVMTDPEVIDELVTEMGPRRNLIIADGHHRYETALNYRDEQRARLPDAPANAGFNYRLVTLVSMSDPGLTILPTHRLIFGYDKLSSQDLLEKAGAFFSIEQVANRPALEARMSEALGDTGRIGLATAGGTYLLTLDDVSAMDTVAPGRTDAWKSLDVSILHELLLERVLGLTKGSIERLEHISYLRQPDRAYEQVASGEAQFLFLLSPTRMEQVEACTAAGEKMPQKSTDFYPKVITGLTMLPVGPEERL